MGKWSILAVHNIAHLPSVLEDVDIVIFGHSHKFLQEQRNGILYLNPGSAGPRRFIIPISMAVLTLGEEAVVQHILLNSKNDRNSVQGFDLGGAAVNFSSSLVVG